MRDWLSGYIGKIICLNQRLMKALLSELRPRFWDSESTIGAESKAPPGTGIRPIMAGRKDNVNFGLLVRLLNPSLKIMTSFVSL